MAKDSEEELLRKIDALEAEREDLQQKLRAKRYKFIDRAVDSCYKIVRFGRRPVEKAESTSRNQASKKAAKRRAGEERKVDLGRVDIINVNFFDWDGKTVFLGGAERYVYDLACLLKEMGYRPRLLQGANEDFVKDYNGIEVRGVKSAEQNMEVLSVKFSGICKDAELVIASPLELAARMDPEVPIIAINHGINFDHPRTTFANTAGAAYRLYERALRNVVRCVCVDTNFLNWVRTREYNLGRKLSYIPNYYDPKTFAVRERKSSEKLRFVYPRRIYEARGADITIEAFTKLLRKYPEKIELKWVGQVDNAEIREKLERMLAEFPEQVQHTTYEPNEMYKAYEAADVVLIPTRYSEGTSLSCIEGMASGAAVIATNVGGLPNLIISGFNGILIKPSAAALEKAAEELILHPEKVKALAENAVTVAKAAFQKDNWDEKWKLEISEVLGE